MHKTIFAILAASLTVGCVATRAELQVVEGKMSYLESRVEKNEELVADISGTAQKEVLASRREAAQKLDETRKQTAELLVKLQELETQTRAMQGQFAEFETRLREVEKLANSASTRADAAAAGPNETGKGSAALTWKNEEEIYDAARKAYDGGDIAQAGKLFDEQLQRWPSGKLAGNAQFWLGEVAYNQKDYLAAVERYLNLAERYKDNVKAPSAYYKMAMALEKLGEREQALRTFQDLIRLFPKSEHTASAEAAIKRLKK